MNLLVTVLLQLFADAEDDEDESGNGAAEEASDESSQREERARSRAVDDEEIDEDLALGCLRPTDTLRAQCKDAIERDEVDAFLMLSVIISSLLLALESPRLDQSSALAAGLHISNYFFTLVFFLEAVLKSMAYGFYATPHAYLKSAL